MFDLSQVDFVALIEELIEGGYTPEDIAEELGLEVRDIIRRMETCGLSPPEITTILYSDSWEGPREDTSGYEVGNGVYDRDWIHEHGVEGLRSALNAKACATNTWSAAGASTWGLDNNWSLAHKPAAGEDIVLDATSVFGCTVDEATASLLSFTLTTGYTGNLTISNSINVAGNVAVDFGGSGTYAGTEGFVCTDTGTFSSDQTNLPKLTINATTKTITLGAAFTCSALAITAGAFDCSTYALGTTTCSVTDTLTLNAVTHTAAAITINDGGTYANGTGTSNITGNLIVGAGVSGGLTTGAGTLHIDGTTTIGAGASMGTAATAYTLNMDGNLIASAGTLIAPNVSGSWTYSGATFTSPTVLTHSSGTIVFDLAGTTTLGNASIQFKAVTINTGATIDTGTNYAYTCAGANSITGTLTPNTSVCTFNGAVTINNLGVLGGNTAWTCSVGGAANIDVTSGGTLNLPNATGSSTFAGASSYITLRTQAGSTLNADSGTVNFTGSGSEQDLGISGTGNLYNVVINKTTTARYVYIITTGLTIDNNLTITLGGLHNVYGTVQNLTVTGATSISDANGLSNVSTATITFNGAVTVNSGGVLGRNTAWTGDFNANVTNDVGGTISSPTGATLTFSGAIFDNNATYTDNGATLTCDLNGVQSLQMNGASITNLTLNGGASCVVSNAEALTVKSTITTNATNTLQTNGNITLTVGTVSVAGAITNNGIFQAYGNTVNAASVFGTATDKLIVATGTDWNWDNTAGIWNIKWINYSAITGATGGGGCTVNLTGNCSIGAWTTTANDTLTTSASVTVTQSASKSYTNAGTTTLGASTVWNGASATTSIIASTGTWTWNTCSLNLVDVQFDIVFPGTSKNLTVAGNIGVDGVTIALTDTITMAANIVTCNSAKDVILSGTSAITGGTWTGYRSFQFNNATAQIITGTTFTGTNGATWNNGMDLTVNTGCAGELSSCTTTNNKIGMQATSGWLSSIADQGVANAHVFYGIANANSMDASYQMLATDNFSIKNANAYSTSFDSVFTLNQTEACATLATSASTTLALVAQAFSTTGIITNAGIVSMTTGTFQNGGVLTNTGTFGSNTAWTGTINAGITNSGGTINLGTGTKTVAASVTIDGGATGTVNVNGGSLVGTSRTTSILTSSSGLAFNWATVSLNMIYLNLYSAQMTTPGTGITITIAGNIKTDSLVISATDTLTCIIADTQIEGVATNKISIYGIFTSTGTASHNVIWGHTVNISRIQIYNGATLNVTYTTILATSTASNISAFDFGDVTTGCTATIDNITVTQAGAAHGGIRLPVGSILTVTNSTFTGSRTNTYLQEDINLRTASQGQFSGCTYSTVSEQATSGWMMSKIDQGVANATVFRGIMSASAPDAAYEVANTDNLTISNATSYSTPFNSVLTLDQAEQCTALTVSASTSLTPSTYAFTATGDVTTAGTLGGNTSWAGTLKDLTISTGGTFNGGTSTITITGETAGNVAWSNSGTFNKNTSIVDFTGQTSPYSILGDNSWATLTITVTAACEYQFEATKTQTIGTYAHLNGATGQLLTLSSTIHTSHWNLTLSVGCTQDFANVAVHDCDASGGLECEAAFSTDLGNDHNWDFGITGYYVWDGGGADALASTAGNWEGDVAPGVTSSVYFGSAASSKACTYDIANTSGSFYTGDDYASTITFTANSVFSTSTIGASTIININGKIVRSGITVNNGTIQIGTVSELRHSNVMSGYGLIMLGNNAAIYDEGNTPLPIARPQAIPKAGYGAMRWSGI